MYELDDVRPSGVFVGVAGGSGSTGGSVTTNRSLSLNWHTGVVGVSDGAGGSLYVLLSTVQDNCVCVWGGGELGKIHAIIINGYIGNLLLEYAYSKFMTLYYCL